MSSNNKIKLNLNIENLGPHKNMELKHETNSIKMGVYANNGSGKTFISRVFRTACSSHDLPISDDLLTRKTSEGKFHFEISSDRTLVQFLDVELKKGRLPVINNNTDYIFHVFNSEFVEDNLQKKKFVPDSDISGFILSKANIDISEEKEELQNLIKKQENVQAKIENALNKGKEDLKEFKIQANTKEYKEFNMQNLINENVPKPKESFEMAKKNKEKLDKMPDFDDIGDLEFSVDYSSLKDLNKILRKSIEKAQIESNILENIKNNHEFIEKGMKLYNLHPINCPFCNQKLSEKAKSVQNYEKYLKSEESEAIKKMDKILNELEKFEIDIIEHNSCMNEAIIDFNSIKEYIPSFKEKLNFKTDNENIKIKLGEIKEIIEKKKKNMGKNDFDINSKMSYLYKYTDKLENYFNNANEKIRTLNTQKNNINLEKTSINRLLCNTKFKKVYRSQKNNIKKLNDLNEKISYLESDISEKEAQNKIYKKEKVVKSLKYFLNFFFNDKYSFDEKTFSITFNEEKLSEKAMKVLSDGEKGIVAFCYYLAMTHTLINNENEYEKLFFIIDDPISSLDYNYVFSVVSCIRQLDKIFDLKFERFIILTHNLDFINMLKTNGIINQQYLLRPNDIKIWNERLMLPYESHLTDVIDIVNGLEPTHTTPNSIRHILETLCHLKQRNHNIEKYIRDHEELKDNSSIYSIVQDLSHGRDRQNSIPDSEIKKACESIHEFISNNYPEHLKI